MLHRVSSCQPRHVLLGGACALLWMLCSGCCCFYMFFAPNREVPLLSGVAALVLLWPLAVLAVRIYGVQVLQVEHAGVAVSGYLGKWRLNRRVWSAAQVLHFDWDYTPDGIFSLRLLVPRKDGTRGFTTVLQTGSSCAMAALWRDLELHYPGSGLRRESPCGMVVGERSSLCLSLVVMLLGLGVAACVWPQMRLPFLVSSHGQVSPARVVAIEWGSTQRTGSPYHLLVLPVGASDVLRTVSSFQSTSGRIPQVGQLLPVLWADRMSCFLPGEVLSFLVPIPVLGMCLVMVWGGIWGIMRLVRHPR